jgi:hypothetical protein
MTGSLGSRATRRLFDRPQIVTYSRGVARGAGPAACDLTNSITRKRFFIVLQDARTMGIGTQFPRN